jgi:hypothetical protein
MSQALKAGMESELRVKTLMPNSAAGRRYPVQFYDDNDFDGINIR